MKLCIVGVGYVGLVSGVCFSELGNKVICVDSSVAKIEKLNNGIMPIYEEGLKDICVRNMREERIEFTTDLRYGVEKSDVIFIAVGTPSRSDGQADLSQLEAVAKSIAQYINGYKIIVNKSTVPVGTQKLVSRIITENRINSYNFDVVSNPEFLREGTAVYDTMNPDRVVIGADSEEAAKVLCELHKSLNAPVVVTDPESAEMIKYATNALLATKISFINEIANICWKVGADIKEVSKGIGLDSRISERFLDAGVGYGGSCLPKDTRAIVKIGEAAGYDFKIVKSVIEVNRLQRLRPVEKLKLAMPEIKGRTITILGLTFKPNTDDMREAPSIDIINEIQKLGGEIKAYDPMGEEYAQKILNKVNYAANAYEGVEGSDAVILITEWKEFKELDLKRVKQLMKGNVFVDGRNVYDYETMADLGFEYYCIGRKDSAFNKNRV
mgnify:CR=1 FL=1